MAAWVRASWLSFFFVLPAVLAEPAPASAFQSILTSVEPVTKALGQSCHYLNGLIGSSVGRPCGRALQGQLGAWDMVALIAACGFVQVCRTWAQRSKRDAAIDTSGQRSLEKRQISSAYSSKGSESQSTATDPGLLRKHSTFKSFDTSFASYTSIRTFYRPHTQADKLPHKPPLPLLVFIHGLGGSLAQFHPLLTSLVNIAPCLGFDLPGCGLSPFSPDLPWEAYSTEALSELVSIIIRRYCHQEEGQGVVLIGHSMGCSISTMLGSRASPLHSDDFFDILGQIAICPKASLPTQQQINSYQRLLRIPTPIFDMWRRWDRRGGSESVSVIRFVGQHADNETRKLQLKFNETSRTAVWRRMAWGALPKVTKAGVVAGGLPGPEIWAELAVPLFLIAGEADNITKADEVTVISRALGKEVEERPKREVSDEVVPQAAAPDVQLSEHEPEDILRLEETDELGVSSTEATVLGSETSSNSNRIDINHIKSRPSAVLKTTVLPKPATHALLYDHTTYRTLAGLIQTFLAKHIDSRLSLGWQLQHLSTEGKWDVKNLVKWQAVGPVSDPIAGIFRAMKTLREIDESHSPAIFVKEWSSKIKAVIDISHESPVYDPHGLEAGGIEYHKFPTVSKIPPTSEEVTDFIGLVDQLRSDSTADDHRLLGVHCHYGFNRTGFFICSYLIERERYGVQRALDIFQQNRPPGIRHEHFIDTLFVRYCIGLKRAPTF